MALDTIYTIYQSGGSIVTEVANRNGNCYSKKGTGNHDGMRIKGNPGTNQWLDRRKMDTDEDISKGILSRDIYDGDSSSLSSNLDTRNISNDDFPYYYKLCSSDNPD